MGARHRGRPLAIAGRFRIDIIEIRGALVFGSGDRKVLTGGSAVGRFDRGGDLQRGSRARVRKCHGCGEPSHSYKEAKRVNPVPRIPHSGHLDRPV